jgi:hypothetical protein
MIALKEARRPVWSSGQVTAPRAATSKLPFACLSRYADRDGCAARGQFGRYKDGGTPVASQRHGLESGPLSAPARTSPSERSRRRHRSTTSEVTPPTRTRPKDSIDATGPSENNRDTAGLRAHNRLLSALTPARSVRTDVGEPVVECRRAGVPGRDLSSARDRYSRERWVRSPSPTLSPHPDDDLRASIPLGDRRASSMRSPSGTLKA